MKPLTDNGVAALAGWLEGQDEFVFLDCARVDEENHRSLLFTRPEQWLVCLEGESAGAFLARADQLREQGKYLAGWFTYEFGYLLEPSLHPLCPAVEGPYAVLGVFDPPLVIDHANPATLPGEISRLFGNAQDDVSSSLVDRWDVNMARQEYLDAVRRIKDYIVAGDTYQVNFTMKMRFPCDGRVAELYRMLRGSQPVSYGAWIRREGQDILSFSPELFFRVNGDRVTVRPMKGTSARGRTLQEDLEQRVWLQKDIKNRSENVMIVDLLRNDLGRLLHGSGGGKVLPRSLFDVEAYDTLLQMTSTIDGIPSSPSMPGLGEMVQALFPCGSVTGAPKIRTMEIIRELEQEPRGVYCGAVGFSGPQESVFNVPIRTVTMVQGRGEMGIGSGIVHDSDPEAEWQESLLKARFLTSPRRDFQLIETLLWEEDSGYWLLGEHMDRLVDSAAYFLFSCDREDVVTRLEHLAGDFSISTRVRLLLSRSGEVELTQTPLAGFVRPGINPAVSETPLPRVTFSELATDQDNIHLYHKTTLREVYESELQRITEMGLHEVLFCNNRGQVTEGAVTNIFISRGGELFTPPVSCGLLAGTLRRSLIDRGRVKEQVLTRDDVRTAEAVFVGNSVRGLVQVQVE